MPAPRFETLHVLGRGASGEARAARLSEPFGSHPRGTRVAVKRPFPGRERDLEREARALATCRHPNLQELLHHGEDEQGPLLVTRLVEGPTLADLAREGPFEEETVRRVGQDLFSALAAVHSAGWLHGDLSPANARLDDAGHAHLLDLGFAEPASAGPRGRGTPAYLSPEEAAGRPKTAASEVHALGLVLYELVTGRHPLAMAGGAEDVLRAVAARGVSLPPSSTSPRVSPFLDALLGATLEHDRGRRPSATQVAERFRLGERSGWWAGGEAREEDTWSARDRLPLVGRGPELALLEGAWRTAAAGRGTVVWLSGPRGVGRSRLVDEAVRGLRFGPHPPVYLSARCIDPLQQRPGHPIRSLLRRWLQLGRQRAPGPREEALLASHMPPDPAHALARVLDPDVGDTGRSEPALLATWLTSLARVQPLVLFLDDLDRAGDGTLEVLARVLEELHELPVLLVLGLGTERTPAELPMGQRIEGLGDRLHSLELRLAPLGERDVLELVETCFVPDTPTKRLARALYLRTGGRPGELDELVRQALESGHLKEDPDGGLALCVPPDDLPRPRSEPDRDRTRLEALDPADRRWLECAAVLGERVESELLRSAFGPVDGASLARHLDTLVSGGWLERRPGLRFPRRGLRTLVLAQLGDGRARELHAQAARALSGLGGTGRALQRAYHLREADDGDALLALVRELLPELARNGHPHRVLTLADWAAEVLDRRPRPLAAEDVHLAFELHVAGADAAGSLGRRDEERAHLDALTDLPLDEEGQPAQVGQIYLLHGHWAADTGRLGLARGALGNAAGFLARAGERDLESEALRRLAEVEAQAGSLREAREHARRARRRARRTSVAGRARLVLGTVALLEDRFDRALAHADAVLGWVRHEEGPGVEELAARAYLLRSRTLRLVGRLGRAHAALQQAARHARDAGERGLESEIAARHGRLLIDLGREQEAERELRDALLSSQEIHDRQGEVLAHLFLGTLLAERDEREGHALLSTVTERARALGLLRAEALALAMNARVERHWGHLERALQLSGEAMGLLHRVGAELSDRIVIVMTRALVLTLVGRADEASGLEQDLERVVRKVSRSLRDPATRRRHLAGTLALMGSARSPVGPLYPRRTLRPESDD